MNIKTKLSLQFTLIVAAILLFFSILVYYFSYSSQLTKFRESLFEKAKSTAILLINVEQVDSALLEKIHQSTVMWEKEETVLTDSALNVIYSKNVRSLTSAVIFSESRHGNVSFFSYDKKDGVCYKHFFNNHYYNVFIMSYDRSRTENLSELRSILFWSIMISVFLSVLLSYLFSRNALKPISKIIKSVKEINSRKLSNRLDEGKGKDEIAQLAKTFNEMIMDLEISFNNQEDFILNASHEFRTPLTVMIGESDYILRDERSRKEYIDHITGLFNDLKKLNSLLNSLLELAQIQRDKSVDFSDVRVDEIVFDAIELVKDKYPGRKIIPKILYPEDENELLIKGNDGLLAIVFRNLLDNACKFSNDDVTVEIKISGQNIIIIISDRGIGIPVQEIGDIYKPFQRGSNVKFIGGFGIGLSLVYKILSLDDAEMNIISKVNEGTSIELRFKRTTKVA